MGDLEWRCRRCGGAPDHAQDFDCATCGWPWSVCQDCGSLVPLFRDEPGREERCDACGPSEAVSAPNPESVAKLAAVIAGLTSGRNEIKAKSGVAWERFSVMTAAWRVAGSPKRGDPGWNAWLGVRNELRLQPGSKRGFGHPTSPESGSEKNP
jgi:hypothetical protein